MTHTSALGVVLILLALGLGLAVTADWLSGVDRLLMSAMMLREQGDEHAWIGAVRVVSTLGDPVSRTVIIALVFALLLGRRHGRRTALVFVGTTIASIAGYSIAKIAFARARPTLAPWLDTPHGLSFPSGHAAGATVVFVLAAHFLGGRAVMAVAIALSLAIGLTRPMLGVHWPSDVVGGWLWGAGCALIGIGVARRTAVTATTAR